MARLTGAALGFLAFAVAILLGLWSNNTFEVILTRALWAMVMFFGLGLFTGWVAYRVLDEHALMRARQLEEELKNAMPAEEAPAEEVAVADSTTAAESVPSGDEVVAVPADAAALP